jgi:hypothetical protein
VALPAHSEPRPLIQFRNHFSQTVGLIGRVISPSQGRYVNTGQHKQNKRIHTHTHTPNIHEWDSFPASERVKTVHALDRAAPVTGRRCVYGGVVTGLKWLRAVMNTVVNLGCIKCRVSHNQLRDCQLREKYSALLSLLKRFVLLLIIRKKFECKTYVHRDPTQAPPECK